MAMSLFNDVYEPRLGRMERTLDSMLGRTGGFGDMPSMMTSWMRPDFDLAGAPLAPTALMPGHAFDVIERPAAFDLVADAPGFAPEDIDVQLDGNRLTVRGRHQEKAEEGGEGGRTWRTERRMASFSRVFTLPDNAKPDEITANLDRGVLKLTVPKAPAEPKTEPKRIQVQGQASAA